MIEIRRIADSNDFEAQQLIVLHGETFPQYERFHGTSLLAELTDNACTMHFNAVYEDGVLAGFFNYWDLGNAYYIHLIAVYPAMRNRKVGQQILDWIVASLHRPVFLESEVPFDEITARRLDFYKRNGFKELAEDPEILSSNRKGGHPQCLMGTRPVADLDAYLKEIRDVVYYAGE